MADAELSGHAARVVDVFDAAALLVAAELLRTLFGPEPHGHADDFVALLMQQRGGDGAVNSAGHAHNNAGTCLFLCYPMANCLDISVEAEERDSWIPESLAQRAVDVLSDHKALDIALIDISRTATFTDYFVIATAQSPLQFSALPTTWKRT